MTNERMIEIAEAGLDRLRSIQCDNLREKAELMKNILLGKVLYLVNETQTFSILGVGEYETMSETSKGDWRMGKLVDRIKEVQTRIDETEDLIRSIKSLPQ